MDNIKHAYSPKVSHSINNKWIFFIFIFINVESTHCIWCAACVCVCVFVIGNIAIIVAVFIVTKIFLILENKMMVKKFANLETVSMFSYMFFFLNVFLIEMQHHRLYQKVRLNIGVFFSYENFTLNFMLQIFFWISLNAKRQRKKTYIKFNVCWINHFGLCWFPNKINRQNIFLSNSKTYRKIFLRLNVKIKMNFYLMNTQPNSFTHLHKVERENFIFNLLLLG